MLMHHRDARALRVKRGTERHRRAIQHDTTARGRIDARKQLDAGAFPGAVLAEQGEDLAGAESQAHLPDSRGSAEPLRRLPQADRFLGFGSVCHHARSLILTDAARIRR